MSVPEVGDGQVAFHLLLDPQECAITRQALDLLISDESHEPQIRGLAREVLKLLESPEDAASAPALTVSVPLTAQQMKITHAAVKLLLNDSSREQQSERKLLWSILEKLPDEHVMRAIDLDAG
jgi:hypothetical protein